MKIGELSQKTGVSARSIRHYEKKNIIKSVRLDNGYREFDESAVERIRIIQLYLGLGLTTEQIENILGCEDAGPVEYSFCQEMLELYQEKIDQVDKQISALETVKLGLGRQIEQMKERRVSAKTLSSKRRTNARNLTSRSNMKARAGGASGPLLALFFNCFNLESPHKPG